MIHRRDFLLGTAAAAGALAANPTRAAGSGAFRADRRLVVVMLDGGNDGLNTLAPIEDDLYHRARPVLGLKKDAVERLDDLNGFHPALAKTAARFREGGVCILRGVGYPGPNLSHFRSRDIWETATLNPTSHPTGWMGRLVDEDLGEETVETAMLSVGRVSTPLAMRAARNHACVVPNGQEFVVPSGSMATPVQELDALQRVQRILNGSDALVGGAVATATASSEAISAALKLEARTTYPDSRLARDLGIAARVIDAGLPTRCIRVEQMGYDHHANQAGSHAELLGTLDGALDAFVRDLAALGRLDSTLILVMSEFGRRVAENGIGATAGTDHGASNLVMLLGGDIRPGIHGGQPDLANLDENGNLNHAIDFRRVYADVVGGWFGLDVATVLGGEFAPAGVVSA